MVQQLKLLSSSWLREITSPYLTLSMGKVKMPIMPGAKRCHDPSRFGERIG